MTSILFTGGGTAGHVTPNIALIESLSKLSWECHYVGSKKGIERELIAPLLIPYHGIYCGKLRRYFSWQNFIDPIFILLGFVQSLWVCISVRPNIVFSKGGFVAVPVVVAAWLCRIPVICHESDITPGLANKLCLPFSRYICVNFPETKQYLPKLFDADRVRVTGSPLRASLQHPDPDRGRVFLGFDLSKPILLVVGGSLGAQVLNQCIWQSLNELCERYQVVHLVGAGNLNSNCASKGYRQFEYLSEEYGECLSAADLVVSRAGANSIFELLSFKKPHLLIPLTAAASRGDQLVNARIMGEAGMSLVLPEAELDTSRLVEELASLEDPTRWVASMASFPDIDAVPVIVTLIQRTAHS